MFRKFFHRLRSQLRRTKIEREMDAELRFHLEMETAENMRRGKSEEEARLAARRSFGGVERTKEVFRDISRFRWLEDFWQDVQYGLRVLGKSPGFMAVAVLALALGIGANTAIFSVVNAVLLRPLPYPNSERLTTLLRTQRQWIFREASVSAADYVEWRTQQSSFEGIAAYSGAAFNLSGGNGPVYTFATTVSADFFPVLGVQPVLGRVFLAEENQKGKSRVVILSHALWQSQFNSDPQTIGKAVKLDDEWHTIVGVMPESFRFVEPLTTDLLVPLEIDANDRSNAFFRVIARLKPSVTREQAGAETETIFGRLRQANPNRSPERGARLVPLHELTAVDSRRALWVLFAAAGFVLLIACANLASLLLARSAVRRKEVAVRAALGASRLRLMRQLLTESVMLSLFGGVAGLALAVWGVDALVALAPQSLRQVNAIRVDWWVMGFTFAVSLATGLLFGIAPALQASKPDLTQALKEGGRARLSGFGRFNLRGALVAGETAFALVLLVGAGLMLNSFVRLMRVDKGFATENVLTLNLRLPDTYRTKEQVENFYRQSLDRLRALPGVTAAGAVNQIPLGEMLLRGDFRIEGRPPLPDGSFAIKPTISPDYFRSMGIPLRRGREFTDRDTVAAPGVAVVSESFARRYFEGEDPVGRRLSMWEDSRRQPIWLEVVGVAGDVKQESLAAETHPAVYTPHTQAARLFLIRWLTFVVRTADEAASVANAAQREIQQVDPDLPMISVKTMDQMVAKSVAEQRFNALLLGVFAALALLLAGVGIYGVMSYAVAQRTHEIGIRLALGAQRRDVLRLVIAQGMALAMAGVAIGLIASFALTRLMKSLLYGVSATDPLTFTLIAALLTSVALLACWVPARRATRVDPLVALRCE